MSNSIHILDNDYKNWIKELSSRYRKSQIKAAVKVNGEMLRFYFELGRDIVSMKAESRWGSGFMKNLSADLKVSNPDATCFSPTNLLYMKNFYLLYQPYLEITPQVGEHLDDNAITPQIGEQIGDKAITPQVVEQISDKAISPQLVEQTERKAFTQQLVEQIENKAFTQQVVERIAKDIFSIPWGHHKILIDKFKTQPQKALFFVHQTVENGWSRDTLLNFIGTDLYERQGKALTNFANTLPSETSDLAQELTKDPYNFAFTGITAKYNERKPKDALLHNITQFLLELGTGFAYVGKEYSLQVGEKEKFIDLLFYNLNLSCYVVVEVKIGVFDFADAGQLGGYVVACNHILRKDGRDNPTIGLLICKQKDNLLAQYAVEASTQPLGISEYELAKLYPEKVEGTMPMIEEIERGLQERVAHEDTDQ